MSSYGEVLDALDARYGSDVLDSWLPKAQQSLKSLRRQYIQHGQPPYATEYDRLAYVLAYHPPHRKLAEWAFEHTSAYVDHLKNRLTLTVVILGAGPCAELVELARFVAARFPEVQAMHVTLVDRQSNWQELRHTVSIPLAQQHFDDRVLQVNEMDADLLDDSDRTSLHEPLCKADLVIGHAVLSEVASAANGTSAINWICERLQDSAILLMVDLGRSQGGQQALHIFKESGLHSLNQASDTLRIGKPPSRLDGSFFAREDGLWARQSVHAIMYLVSKNEVQVSLPPLPIDFTPDQQDTLENFARFLHSPSDASIAVLRGAAGTGKSTLLRELVRVAFEARRNPLLLAPTGQARRRLHEATDHPANTVHSALYTHKHTNVDDEGGREVKFGRSDDFLSDLLIIDEASLIGDKSLNSEDDAIRLLFNEGQLLSDSLELLDNYRPNMQILFVGDHHQLPPIGERDNRPALDPGLLESRTNASVPLWELQTVVRQASGSPILATATSCRSGKPLAEQSGLTELSVSKLSDYGDDLKNGDAVVIAWTNNSVAAFNREIRAWWGRTSETPQKGDRLVTIRGTSDRTFINGDEMIVESVGSRHDVTRQLGKNGERVTARLLELVVTVEGVNEQVSMDVRVLLDGIEGQKQDAIDKVERVLTIDAMVRYQEQYGEVENPRSKEDFLRSDPVVNALRVVYPYARTCHRAQGSEWDTVIVDLSHDTGPPPGWEYTAVTRARKQLVVVNKRQATAELDVAAELRPLIENLALQVDFLELQHGAQQLTISDGSSELLVNVYLKQSLPSKINHPHGNDTLWNLVNPVLLQWAARVRARYRPINDLTVSKQLNKLMGTVDASGIQVTCYKVGQWEVEVDAIDKSGNHASFRLGHNSAGVLKPKKIAGEGAVGDLLSSLRDNMMH